MLITGIRKKRAAPKPPISRPLSSAISTQALERIVDSEESLTSDMGNSKPPSDIAVSSEAEVNSKANSDIAVGSHASRFVAKKFYPTKESSNDTTTVVAAEINDAANKRDSIAKLESPQILPVQEKSTLIEEIKNVETARAPLRGKLGRNFSSFDNNKIFNSFILQNSYEKIHNINETIFPIKKPPLTTISSPTFLNLSNHDNFSIPRRSVQGMTKLETEKNHNDVMIMKKLMKIPTINNLNSVKHMPIADIFNNKYSDKNISNYTGTMITDTFPLVSEKINEDNSPDKLICLTTSNSFCCPKNKSQDIKNQDNRSSLRLGPKYVNSQFNLTTLRQVKKSHSLSEHDFTKYHLSPSLLTNLQIFEFSTKPVDIQISPLEPIPNEIHDLPSFPVLNKVVSKTGFDKKFSILEPPPPGLVSRQESNDNWNKFLVQLNSIVETRSGEFV